MWTVRSSVVFRGERGMKKWAQKIFRALKLPSVVLSWRLYAIIHLSQSTECTIQRVNPNANYGLLVIMIHQCKFINFKNLPLSWQMLIGKCGFVGRRARRPWQISVCSMKFCCESETALEKNRVSLKKQTNKETKNGHSGGIEEKISIGRKLCMLFKHELYLVITRNGIYFIIFIKHT